MADNRPCKAELLDWINTVSFVCDDTKLFLDTHPCNTEALEFYEEFKNQRMQALQEYAKYYGPLTLDTMCTPADKWKWILPHAPVSTQPEDPPRRASSRDLPALTSSMIWASVL